MKPNPNLLHLLQQFLKTSPRARALNRASILPPEYRPSLNKLPSDQEFVKNFILNLNVSYMYDYYGPPTVTQHKIYLHKKSFVNPLSAGLTRRKGVELNDPDVDKKTLLLELIKCLNKDKNTVMRYTELQEFLFKLTVNEARQYKKFIVYLYKWLLNEKHTFTPHSIQQELCQQTSEIIIKKIYEAHETGDYEILKNTEEELLTIETLEKAREMKRNGKALQARDIYETVYFGRFTDEVDRLQALQFICEKSKQQLDNKFLQSMLGKIKEGFGLKSHQRTLSRIITQIKDLQTPLDQLLNAVNQQQESLQETEPKENMAKILLDSEVNKDQMNRKRKKEEASDRSKGS